MYPNIDLGKQMHLDRLLVKIAVSGLVLAGCGRMSASKEKIHRVIDTYPDGQVNSEHVYDTEDDTMSYVILEHFPNELVSFQGEVKEGKFVGAKLNYYDNGVLRSIDSLRHPCDLLECCCDGRVLRYYRNGKSDQDFELKDNLRNGHYHFYSRDSTGVMITSSLYSNDMKNGPCTTYYESGAIKTIGTYRNDTLSGDEVRF